MDTIEYELTNHIKLEYKKDNTKSNSINESQVNQKITFKPNIKTKIGKVQIEFEMEIK